MAEAIENNILLDATGLSPAALEAFFAHATLGLCVINHALQFVRVNEALAQFNSLSVGAHHGKTIEEVLGERGRRLIEICQQVFATRTAAYGASIEGFDPAEKVQKYFAVDVLPFMDEHGAMSAVLGIVRDVTAARHVEQEREVILRRERAARETAEAANTSKDRFLAALSHELRTPLTPVVVATDLLMRDPKLPEFIRDELALIRRNVELEARLIDDLLDLTRITRGQLHLAMEIIDARDCLRAAIDICGAEIHAKNLRWQVNIPNEPLAVRADASRVQQVLWNILKNAIKFTPSGGLVTVSAGQTAPDARAHRWLEVRVIDTGIGIAPEMIDKVFDAFERGGVGDHHKQFGGLGLGLAISKAIVELHGGTLEATSEGTGKGATFVLRMPLTDAARISGCTPAPGPANEVEPSRPLRVLLVEDHADSAAVIRRLLRASGHTICYAPTVADARAALDREAFDVVVSDIGLPDGTGLDVVDHILRRGLTLPAVAVSGYGMEEDLARSKAAGFKAHLTKPINPKVLEATLVAITRR